MIADSDSKKRMEAAGSSEGLRVLLGELAAGVATEFWHHFIICLIVHLIPEPRSPFPFRDLLEGRDLLLQLLALLDSAGGYACLMDDLRFQLCDSGIAFCQQRFQSFDLIVFDCH